MTKKGSPRTEALSTIQRNSYARVQSLQGTVFQLRAQDAFERSVLFLDVLRQRGNDYLEQSRRTAPHVLNFKFNLLIDGRTLPKPVNYVLVRNRSTRRRYDRPTEAAIYCFRSARRSRTGHWRDEA